MTKRLTRWGHCHRCLYTWRMRRQYPSICPRCKSKYWRVPKLRPVVLGNGLGIEEIVGARRSQIERLVRKYSFSNPRVFGSVARREATSESDLDLLVTPLGAGLLDQIRLTVALRELLGRDVDVVPDDSLRWYAEPSILAEAIPL